MKWTDQKPTVPGWYWYTSGPGDAGALDNDDPMVIEIGAYGSGLELYVTGEEEPLEPSKAHGQFAGPLAPPDADGFERLKDILSAKGIALDAEFERKHHANATSRPEGLWISQTSIASLINRSSA